MATTLTTTEKVFILENRLSLSMNDMADQLNVGYSSVRNYMVANNLQLTKAQVTDIRLEKLKKRDAARLVKEKQEYKTITRKQRRKEKPTWVSDPWNHNLNPITMQR